MVTKKIYEKKEKIKKQRNKECKIKEKNERAKGKNETNIMCKEYVRVCMCLCMCMKKKWKNHTCPHAKKIIAWRMYIANRKLLDSMQAKREKKKK